VQYSDEDIDQQVRIKEALDPSWLLNPGKVFPIEERDAHKLRGFETELLEGHDVP